MNKTAKLITIFVLIGVIAVGLTALVWLKTASVYSAVVQTPFRIASQAPEFVMFQGIDRMDEDTWPDITYLPLQDPDGDRLVMGGTYVLEAGETLAGNLVIMGGVATLESGSTVEGDVAVMGGSVHIDGLVEGDVIAFGGLIDLGEEAIVEGDISTLGGNLSRAAGARVEGNVNNGLVGPFPSIVVPSNLHIPQFSMAINPFWQALSILLRSFVWAAIAVLLLLLIPDHSERVGRVMMSQPLISGGLGLLTIVAAPVILVIIAFTCIGIPISLVGFFALAIAWAFGVIAVGLEVGKRLVKALKQDWALPVSAALGVFLVTLVSNSVNAIVPCVGWMLPALIGMLGLGAVILTRFGTQDYPTYVNASTPEGPESPQALPDAVPSEGEQED